MRIITFNVNGIRATLGKSKSGAKDGSKDQNVLTDLITEQAPDVLCLQEVKTQSEADVEPLRGLMRHVYTHFASNRKGYSGVAMLSMVEPAWVSYGFDRYTEEELGYAYTEEEYSLEGRVITARFENAIVVTVYVPNAKPELARIAERVRWEECLRAYLCALRDEHDDVAVILCGDLNVCPADIDIHQPRQKKGTPGVSPEERAEFQALCGAGWVDSFRVLHPDRLHTYSYWSNFGGARANNKGWRIDMVMVDEAHRGAITVAECLAEYHGSDHCPVLCELAI
jgi:exodeoxyribonuclease-3